MDMKDWLPVISAVITGVISTILTNYLTLKRINREIKMKNYMVQLEKVYAPIAALIEDGVVPGSGYEGLSANQIGDIDRIVKDNALLVDTKLYSLLWDLKEHAFFDCYNEAKHLYDYDSDGKLRDHVLKRYHVLRKKLYLNYDKRYIGLGRIIWTVKNAYYTLLINYHRTRMRVKNRIKK